VASTVNQKCYLESKGGESFDVVNNCLYFYQILTVDVFELVEELLDKTVGAMSV